MACIGPPPLLVADEPTAELDGRSAGLVAAALLAVARHGTTVVAASHDLRLVRAADVVVTLERGRVVRVG